MDKLYGIRFNGHKLSIHKYKVAATYENGIMELENITPGINRLMTHISPRVHKSRIGKLIEQDNSYSIYIDALDKLKGGVEIILDRVKIDKANYLKAVEVRVAEFEAQISTIMETDLTEIIKAIGAKI